MADTTNEVTKLDPALLKAFREAFSGWLIQPGDADYDAARRVWNGEIDRHPALIARCTSAADVALALHFAAAQQLPVAVRGGGHSSAGHGTCDDGLVIDLSGLKEIELDSGKRTVRAGAGLRWGELLGVTLEAGYAIPSGTISTVGVGGLTLGGGFGWLSRKHGLTIDNLLSAEIVTPDGTIRQVSAGEHADLFWAIRGGGGNFGVVTSFEFRLHPVNMVYGGLMAFPAERMGDLLRFYRDFSANAPDELTTQILRLTLPPAPFVSAELHHQPAVALGVCYCGDLEDGAKAVQPWLDFAEPLVNLVGPMPYRALVSMLDDAAPAGMFEDMRAGYVTELSDDLIDTLVAATGDLPPMPAHLELQQLGGAIGHVDVSATAYSHRDKPFHATLISGGMERAAADRSAVWLQRAWTALEPHTTGVYVNFMGHHEAPERVRTAYSAETFARLTALKRTYDPDNVLALNANIEP
jgi:FAD/FMN-containing dehydrogenase